MVITRGFVGRGRAGRDPRLPPGQHDAGGDWPVLHAEATPSIDTADWTFAIDGLVDTPAKWTWDEIHALPGDRYEGAIHCVTTWSKFGMTFDGVSIDTLLEITGLRDDAAYVLARSHTGYTTNLPIEDVVDGRAWVVWDVDGAPLDDIHGGPARLLVPHLYFWKSAKWVSGLTFMAEDEPGFWERNGYHDHGDPWLEQRYQGD
ncbi:DMSO/TMAO reductase YedYZ, molybdopterin-dependent catalytic subunit [Amycolatopsis pretoriensis]|uniref:DMSO/TMAO reductase YedYZ, molybdopterin-dependent catalytic subunit n=1 Tax=Amycolatopsis pretoriensis TaxID=218821 RepID=A0A1H5Q416_9PSEU|nr:sulfite oxidase-like oxidoreductase [Amycolatopsis pretoriensis]SEF20669.1 DMSO/TMAO reductase YedYZ, molybdopterin-dependent catalytic subunit [Amycolatopsis pretoriensis]